MAGEHVWDARQSLRNATEPRACPAVGWQALVDALNFFDVVFAVVTASRWPMAERRKDAARVSAVEYERECPHSAGDIRRRKTSDVSQALDAAQAQMSSTRLG